MVSTTVRRMSSAYRVRRAARSYFIPVRGLRYHTNLWGEPAQVSRERPLLVLMHGWMDVGASFQFVVDALDAIEGPRRCVIAPDWRICRVTGPALERFGR